MNRFRIIALTGLIAAVITGCSEENKNSGALDGEIIIESDSHFIRCNGSDTAELKVTLIDASGTEHDVTASADIYLDGTDKPLDGNLFSTDKEGEYQFYALYGLEMSQSITIAALQNTPEIPADPQAESFDFKHRVLLIQHTGSDCPNCPRMMTSLKTLSEDNAYNNLYSHAAAHSYNATDAAYSDAAKSVSSTFCSGSYPEATFNLTNKHRIGTDISKLKSAIDALSEDKAQAAASVAVETLADKIYVRTEVKAGAEEYFRIAVWLLEDNIYSRQSGASESWQNYHENCIRAMAGETPGSQLYGAYLGTLKAGDKIGNDFVFTAEDGWKVENCKALVIITKKTDDGNYDVVNTAVCKVGETTPYEYN